LPRKYLRHLDCKDALLLKAEILSTVYLTAANTRLIESVSYCDHGNGGA